MSKYYKKSMKGILGTQKMLITEQIGYGVAGKIAGDVDTSLGNTMASGVFRTGAGLAGIPSLVSGAGTVLGSMDMLYPSKKKHKRR